MPDVLWRHLGDEHEPAVGELDRAVGAICLEDQLADEVAVDVRRAQLAGGSEPSRVDLAAADKLTRLDIEDVGEVGLDLDLDREPDGPPTVVDDVVVLVHTAGHGPVDPEGDGLAGHDPVAIEQLGVGVFEARRVEQDG